MNEFNSIYTNFKENKYIPVTIIYQGKTWKKVKLRIRGDSSRELPKKSLKLKFSKETPFITGATKINLNAEWYDKTYMAQYISSFLMKENGVTCFSSKHVPIYLNGEFYGIYLMIENIDKKFLAANFKSNSAVLYKATKDGACFNDTSEVSWLWEKKTRKKEASRADLQQLISEINKISEKESYEFYRENFYYDKLITQVALNILLGNKSTYYHNYYMLHDVKESKWEMLPWDMDKTLEKSLLQLPYTRSTWSEGVNSNLPDNPIPEFVFLNRKMRDDLKGMLKEIVDETFNLNYLEPILDSLKGALDNQIELDITDNVSSKKEWKEAILELKNFIEERPKVVFDQIENWPTPFMVFPIKKGAITWTKSKSVSPITYRLSLCEDKNFKESKVYIFETKENEFIPKELPKGNYYYYVTAINDKGKNTGFRIKNKVVYE